jgi:hypothetical protein
MSQTRRYKMPKVRMLHLSEKLHANSIKVASLCVPPRSSKDSIDDMMASIMDVKTVPEGLSESIAESPTVA